MRLNRSAGGLPRVTTPNITSPPGPPDVTTQPVAPPQPYNGGAPIEEPTPPPPTMPAMPDDNPNAGTGDQDYTPLPSDVVGDIPPPPVPAPPISGPGVGGVPGTEAGTFSRPGTRGEVPFRTAAFTNKRPPRFGPGVPVVGGVSTTTGLSGDNGLGLSPQDAADLLRQLAAGRRQG